MFGVVQQSLVALRSEPFDRSEMVSQLLFGETFRVIEEYHNWLRIQSTYDGYEGWMDIKAGPLIDEEQHNLLTLKGASSVATRLFSAKASDCEWPIRLCPGSTLYNYSEHDGSFSILGKEFKTFNVPYEKPDEDTVACALEYAKYFINTPYLWGGRSPYGIDCSGLVQVVFKMVGQPIARDANQQVGLGSTVDFIDLAQPGDLAFFDNEDGNIIHVGIILGNNQILHSAGNVKVDLLDHQGIFSVKTKKYSHKLRVIKRLL